MTATPTCAGLAIVSSSPSSPCHIEALEARRMLSSAYGVLDLGAAQPTYAASNSPIYLNNRGEVIASSSTNTFLFSSGNSVSLGSITAKLKSATPLAINNSEEIVGTFPGPRIGSYYESDPGGIFSFPYKHYYHLPDAFTFVGQKFRDIGTGAAVSVNDSGEVAELTTTRALLVVGGKRHALKLPPHVKASSIKAFVVDNAGNAILAANHLYKYAPGARTAVEISPLTFSSIQISSGGAVLGRTATALSYIVQLGQTTAVSPFTPANSANYPPRLTIYATNVSGINASGEMVGTAGGVYPDPNAIYPVTTATAQYAIVYLNGVWADLNTLAPATDTGWTLESAGAINDAGQIAAVGIDAGGEAHNLLLTPVLR